jgi:hypothetical protein
LKQREIFRPLRTRHNRFSRPRQGVNAPRKCLKNGVNPSAAQTPDMY